MSAPPIPVPVMLVCMFEPAKPRLGEAHFFREAEGLRPFHRTPAGTEVWRNERGLFHVLSGVGTGRAAVTMTELGHDPAFDFRRTYWVIAGIGGVNPNAGTLGSVFAARWSVDIDLAHEIDPREAPDDWDDYVFPLQSAGPAAPAPPRGPGELFDADEVFALDPGLARWAVAQAAGLDLAALDTPAVRAARAAYDDYRAAQGSPAVALGDNASGQRFWHGARLNAFAERWVRRWTGGAGTFATSSMEDTGTLRALRALGRAGRADPRRALLLRAASNFTMQPNGRTALQSLTGAGEGQAGHEESMYPGYLPSLRALQAVGSRVLHALLDGWPRHRERPPAA